jgi:ribosomal protein L40E
MSSSESGKVDPNNAMQAISCRRCFTPHFQTASVRTKKEQVPQGSCRKLCGGHDNYNACSRELVRNNVHNFPHIIIIMRIVVSLWAQV